MAEKAHKQLQHISQVVVSHDQLLTNLQPFRTERFCLPLILLTTKTGTNLGILGSMGCMRMKSMGA